MSELGVFAYCAAVGFVSAATLSSFYQWVTSEQADFAMARATPAALVLTVLISMFAGPFILWRKVLAGLQAREISALPALIGVALTGMWSVCAGIFYVSLLIAV